jgi:2-(1,2-epoxy-1,2-dihydrophenyl)acetyl-CoA isomerase
VALQLLLTGDQLPAADAARMGLVNNVIDEGEDVRAAAVVLAQRLAQGPPKAMAAAKALVRRGLERPLPEALLLELEIVSALFDAPERTEGVAAFLEKRIPRF